MSGRVLAHRVLGILLGLASLQISLERSAGQQDSTFQVTIRFFDYAGVPTREINQAKRTVEIVFGKAAVEVEWLGCRVPACAAPRPARCDKPMSLTEVALRIMPRAKDTPTLLGSGIGASIVTLQARPGSMVTVFYDRIKRLAEDSIAERGVILGCAAVHEIGHVLTCSTQHAEHGIMRGRWTREDLRLAAQRCMLFTDQYAARLRAALGARAAHEQAHRATRAEGGKSSLPAGSWKTKRAGN